MSKKKKTDDRIYLVGCTLKEISSRKLPTNRQMLQLFFYQHQLSKNPIREKAVIVANEIIVFWKKGGIPTCRFRDIIKKIIKLHTEWKNLQKNQNRKFSRAQIEKEKKFKQKLDRVFDIAEVNEKDVLGSTQKIFLEGQRNKTRRGLIEIDANTNLATDSPGTDADDNNGMFF